MPSSAIYHPGAATPPHPPGKRKERWSQPPHRRALWRTAKTASPRQKRSVAAWRLEDPHLGRVVRPWVSDDPLPDELELIPSPEALHGCTVDGGDGGPPSPHEEMSRKRDLNPSGEVVQSPKPKAAHSLGLPRFRPIQMAPEIS